MTKRPCKHGSSPSVGGLTRLPGGMRSLSLFVANSGVGTGSVQIRQALRCIKPTCLRTVHACTRCDFARSHRGLSPSATLQTERITGRRPVPFVVTHNCGKAPCLSVLVAFVARFNYKRNRPGHPHTAHYCVQYRTSPRLKRHFKHIDCSRVRLLGCTGPAGEILASTRRGKQGHLAQIVENARVGYARTRR